MIRVKLSKIKMERSKRRSIGGIRSAMSIMFDDLAHPDSPLNFKDAAWESELFNELFGELNKEPPFNPFTVIRNMSV